MDKSAFEMLKNSERTNGLAWLLETPFLSYGVVVGIVDINTVIVQSVVQSTLSEEMYTVNLLSTTSYYKEEAVYPHLNDLVILFFLQKHNPKMFMDPARRNAETGKPTIPDPDATGYNRFSGVGVLLSTVKGAAATVIKYDEDEHGPTINARTIARLTAAFNKACSLIFDNPRETEDEEPTDEPVDVLFGAHTPVNVSHKAAVTRKYGVDELPDHTLAELNAPVSEEYSQYAPITRNIQGTVDEVHGIRTDSEGNEEETEAATTETYGTKAPITKDIRAAQTYKVGIGPEEDTEAPVNVEVGEKSDITLTSKSALTLHFDKAVLVESADSYDLVITGALTLTSDDTITLAASGDADINAGGNATVKADGDVNVEATGNATVKGSNVTIDAATLLTLKTGDASTFMPNIIPVCPLGPLHGGPGAGITKLKGG